MNNSKIEWTDHTFNPFIGCTKVSPGCQHCYAENLMDKRFGRVQWGPQGTRSRTSDAEWRKPLAWNRQQWAECTGCGWRGQWQETDYNLNAYRCPVCTLANPTPTRQRVFCASLADIAEEKADQPEMIKWLADLLTLVQECPHLDWLFLTKRIDRFMFVVNRAWQSIGGQAITELPANVWIGTSVENQETADERIPHLLKVPARVRFLSVEPLLGPVDLYALFDKDGTVWSEGIHWVIVGGESGNNARPMHPEWVRSIRNQCQVAGVPFSFKQWGEWLPFTQKSAGPTNYEDSEYFQNLKVQTLQLPQRAEIGGSLTMYKVGKKAAGRLLDGREWNEFPK